MKNNILILSLLLSLLLVFGCASNVNYTIQPIEKKDTSIVIQVHNASSETIKEFVLNKSIVLDYSGGLELSVFCDLNNTMPISETSFDLAPGENRNIEIFCYKAIEYEKSPILRLMFTRNYSTFNGWTKLSLPVK